MLGIRLELLLPEARGQAVTNSGQHILNRPARRRVIENLRDCDKRKRSARCAYSIFLAGALSDSGTALYCS
jgi:hypothetical protein